MLKEDADERWHALNTAPLEQAYLAAADPRSQSGFRGDAARWTAARRVIAHAIDRDGALLDIGCANGHLLETLVDWTRDDGHVIEPWGLDISAALVDLARARLPDSSAQLLVGDALTWTPPRRFDYVRTELVYVPEWRQAGYVRRLMEHVVAPEGRLIVCSYGSARRPTPRAEPPAAELRGWGWRVSGEAQAADPDNAIVITHIAWLDGEARETCRILPR
jgi:SAM-dependent methyltransferase